MKAIPLCQWSTSIEREGEYVKRSERGSVTIEATIVISLVLLLLFGSVGTLLTIYVDTQMEWTVQSASDEMVIIGMPFSDRAELLKNLMMVKVSKGILDREIEHFVEITALTLENINGHDINIWEISYDYKFLSFASNKKIKMPFKVGNDNDGLKFQSSTVYITTYGEKYHLEQCFHLRKSKFPIDIDEAVSKGYEPCKNCHKNIESR